MTKARRVEAGERACDKGGINLVLIDRTKKEGRWMRETETIENECTKRLEKAREAREQNENERISLRSLDSHLLDLLIQLLAHVPGAILLDGLPLEERFDQSLEVGVDCIGRNETRGQRRVGSGNGERGGEREERTLGKRVGSSDLVEVGLVDVSVVATERRVDDVIREGEGVDDGDW